MSFHLSRLRLLPGFLPPEEADWMFSKLLAELPWSQKTNYRQGVYQGLKDKQYRRGEMWAYDVRWRLNRVPQLQLACCWVHVCSSFVIVLCWTFPHVWDIFMLCITFESTYRVQMSANTAKSSICFTLTTKYVTFSVCIWICILIDCCLVLMVDFLSPSTLAWV